ncbi:protein kintoun [Anopheles stephensi]|uniref:Protein kintoun n=1 Tax=Anopheles stephensi TaxID=30069 RepID=A0A182YBZ8_ANOST|nr:protein kintoun [Anopheles stephensi]
MSTKDFNISRDEFRNITRCLDNEEFRGLFMEYCNDLRDNRKQYEDELSQLEAQRGYDVKFLKPSPGYVIKTIVDGKRKGFVNVCQCELVQKPTSTSGVNEDGTKGLKWSIPYAQSQPRKDYDNKQIECIVYDVMFHPDALHLASKNDGFRKLLNDTSLDAVEKSFSVKLDRANLRFPKLQYKGTPSSAVVRQKMPGCDSLPKDELFDKLLPPLPKAEDSKMSETKTPKSHNERTGKTKNKENIDRAPVTGTGGANPFYATPEYKIIQCRDVEYGEMTNELDAKIDVTIPRALKVVITLPLLRSASECALDVTKTTMYLVSEKPAKYKLELKLPYEVKENEGKASFNIDERSLTVTLPVLRKRNITLQDINSVNASAKQAKESGKLIEEINTIPAATVEVPMAKATITAVPSSVVEAAKKTVFPKFSVNKMENLLAFTLNVRNVDPSTIQLDNRSNSVYCRFSNLGNGYFPCFYLFFVRFPNAQVTEIQHEEWDNNLIIQITLNTANVSSYHAGPDEHDTVEYSIMEDITDKINKFGKEIEDDSLCIAVVRQANATAKVKSDGLMSIEITKREEVDQTVREPETEKEEEKSSMPEACSATSAEECDEKDGSEAEKARTMLKAKRNSRKKKKQRSLSDSFCDHLKVIVENEATTGNFDQPKVEQNPTPSGKVVDTPETKARKARSISECGPVKESDGGEEAATIPTLTRKYKSILKRSSYDRSISECSSVDDLGTSVEMARSIGEECRKTVRFNNSIRKQLFRSNSCILTMKKKAQKRKEVQRRADARRMSEGESTDNDEKDAHRHDDGHCSSSDQHDDKDAMEHDSGVSFDSESGDKEAVAVKAAEMSGGRGKSASKRKNNSKSGKSAGSKSNNGKKQGTNAKNIEFKSDMIFDIEI